MKNSIRRLIPSFFFAVVCGPLSAETTVTTPPLIPNLTLEATFVTNSRFAIFNPGEKIELWLQVKGWRQKKDDLLWEIRDFSGKVVDAGLVEVPAGNVPWEHTLALKSQASGYFEAHLRLKKAEVTLPRAGSRPAGYLTYGVSPEIKRLPLEWNDDSRFGGQGTNFLETGKFMEGNPYDPLYPAIGMVWAYDHNKMGEREAKGPGSVKPVTNVEEWKKRTDYWAKAGLSPLIDLHGLPDWLLSWPEGKKGRYDHSTNAGQTYAPNDWKAFENYVRNIALEQAARREASLPRQKNTYYQIHWEPDWHWKGTDEEFVKMYEVAHKAIHGADPKGLLVGPNYGVLQKGNSLLERLFEKGLGRYLDGIATHTYYIPFGLPEPRGLPRQVRDLVAMTRKHLEPGAKIINTEWGTDYHGRSIFKDPSILRQELKEFMRGHLITLGEGIDCTWYFYTADHGMHGGGLMFNLTFPNPVFGAIWVSPKPVAMAAATATRLLDGTTSLGPLECLGENMMAYLFDRNGERVISLWTTDEHRRELRIPAGPGEIAIYDAMGNKRPVPTKDGFATITVDDIPSYLVGISDKIYPSGALVDRDLPHGLPGSAVFIAGFDSSAPVFAYRNGVETRLTNKEGKILLPKILAPGTWLVVQGEKAFLSPEKASLLIVDPPVLLTENAGSGVRLLAQTDVPVEGYVRFEAGDRDVTSELINLPPRKEVTVSFPADILSLPLSGHVRAQFVGKESALSPPVNLSSQILRAKRTENPPDSKKPLDGWLFEEFVTLDTAKDMRTRASDWTGPEDLSAWVGFRFDDENLYIAIKVRDQSHVQSRDAANLWQNDSIQIGLAAGPTSDGWSVAQKLAVALHQKDGSPIVTREPHSSGLPDGIIDPARFRTVVFREGDETTYSLAIPWAEIDPREKVLPASRRIGIGLFINDVDVSGATLTERKVMEGFGEGMGFFLPANFGVLRLDD